MEYVVDFYCSSERNVGLARNPNLSVETLGVDASSPHFRETYSMVEGQNL